MVQHSLLADRSSVDWPTRLRNYFLPLPNRNIFSFVLLSAFVFILATPLIIINTGFLIGSIARPLIATILILAFIIPLAFNCIRLLRYYLRPRPTDHEYDTWVLNHEASLYQEGFSQLPLDESELIEKALCIQGMVWPNSKEAESYLSDGYPRIRWDRYGTPHASVNRFVFFYPTLSAVVMFTSDVNALSEVKYSRAQKYFYRDIVGFEIVPLKAQGYPSNGLQQFEIHVSGGQRIGVPLSPSDPNAMDIVKLLNALLREHQNA